MIIFEAYLGLGIQPPSPSWGAMIAEGRDVYLRDRLDPYQRGP